LYKRRIEPRRFNIRYKEESVDILWEMLSAKAMSKEAAPTHPINSNVLIIQK
jgi:hypothetical protein